MTAIADFTPIEADLKRWERQREVAHWKTWFETNETAVPPAAETLDLRLAFLAEEARLQWRTRPDAAFADLKQAQAKRFGESIERGTLTLAPDAMLFWGALHKSWSYESWWSIRYRSEASCLPLNRLLRLPLPPERFVNADGEPLARPAEPLRLQLTPPPEDGDDYELRLITADGQEPPPIRFVLNGQPTLYITETAIYAGPPRNALEQDSRKVIPAPALETAGGIRFLHALNLPLPKHLAGRTKIIPVAVTLACALKQSYPGSKSESIVLRATAWAEGLEKEEFGPTDWQAPNPGWAPIKPPKPVKGWIPVYDRSAQAHFPRVLEPLGAKYANYGGGWTLRLTKKTPEIFPKSPSSSTANSPPSATRPSAAPCPSMCRRRASTGLISKSSSTSPTSCSRRRKPNCSSTPVAATCAWARKAGGACSSTSRPRTTNSSPGSASPRATSPPNPSASTRCSSLIMPRRSSSPRRASSRSTAGSGN
jgi:hypothetical protein